MAYSTQQKWGLFDWDKPRPTRTAVTLTLYNTLTRKKETFEPIDPSNVRMYVCGPTVYDFAHIGNARPVIVFDVLYRLLKHLYPGPGTASDGSRVTYVRNITDVDDKINARSAERYPDMAPEAGIRKLTEETAAQFHADIAALGVLPPTHEPRATENIQQMIDIIVALLEKGHAYVAAGEVLFDVRSMKEYGELSNRNLDDQQAGARVEVEAHKKNPGDFVLWKLSEPHEPGWESPWGRGRPGWHIECSAMSARYLGEVFDIHGGGLDLIFPHHENEIAQSRCAHGTPVMAKTWMHNGFLQVEGEKMSKSLGNFVTINELLETEKFGGQRWSGDVIRLTMLRTHYRQPIDWTHSALRENQKNWASIGNVIRDVSVADEHDAQFLRSMLDDLNTSAAITRLFELRDAATVGDLDSARQLRKAFQLLGFFREWNFREVITLPVGEDDWELSDVVANILQVNADIELTSIAQFLEREYQRQASSVVWFLRKFGAGTKVRDLQRITQWFKLPSLDAARKSARVAKDFKESDRIRDELAVMGIALKDTKNKETGEIETTWEVAR